MKSALSILALVVAATITLPANASVGDSAIRQPGLVAVKAGVPAQQQVARRGADDPVNHDINDDKGGQNGKSGKGGKGGNDDGPNPPDQRMGKWPRHSPIALTVRPARIAGGPSCMRESG